MTLTPPFPPPDAQVEDSSADYEEFQDFWNWHYADSISLDDSFYSFPDEEEHRVESAESVLEGVTEAEAGAGAWALLRTLVPHCVQEAQENDRNGHTSLIIACYHRFLDPVVALAECPHVDVNRQDREENTALITAAGRVGTYTSASCTGSWSAPARSGSGKSISRSLRLPLRQRASPRRLRDCVRSTLTPSFLRGPEDRGAPDQVSAPEIPAAREPQAEEAEEAGAAEGATHCGPASHLPLCLGSGPSLLLLQRWRRSSVRPGVVVPPVGLSQAPTPTFHPAGTARKGSTWMAAIYGSSTRCPEEKDLRTCGCQGWTWSGREPRCKLHHRSSQDHQAKTISKLSIQAAPRSGQVEPHWFPGH
ncbi:hypothetical protein P7K49_022470 [Saguinus oedipus]|uniref:Uncharacterized protein n=1 Tax=Saguinus oedipus TaxID=9490 RepID=A0ABQ9UY15_SAGOE|nr:hypothetical protein P7K49_022470 [Saguinus oedipus]